MKIKKYTPKFYNRQSAGSISSADKIVPIILKLFNPTTVVDVGCGIGTWLKVFEKHGIKSILGIDSHANFDLLLIDKNKFEQIDLNTLEINNCVKKWDIAISLETAEHLQPENSRKFIENLTKLSDIIIFSAAIPYQGGRNHINEKWQDEWEILFLRFGFKAHDLIRPQIWSNEHVEWWYAQNIIVYINTTRQELIAEMKHLQIPSILNIVHPRKYIAMTSFKHITFKQWIIITKILFKKLFLTKAQKRALIYVK